MKLYMRPVSMTSRPLRLFMAEKGLKADEEVIGLMTGAHFRELRIAQSEQARTDAR